MRKILMFVGAILFFMQPMLVSAAETEILTISGSGDSQFLLQTLADVFNGTGSGFRVVIPNSIGTGGGIRALLAGEISLARTARPLNNKERGRGLVEFHFAKSPIALVAHRSVEGVDNLTSAQLTGIYAGEYTRWSELGGPDAKIYPVDREPGDSSRTVLEEKFPRFKEVRSQGKVFYTTPEAAQAIQSHPYTIGYLPLNIALKSGLKVLHIDDRSPFEYVASETGYPLIVHFYLVSRGEPAGAVRQFLAFLCGDKIRVRLQAEGVRPVQW